MKRKLSTILTVLVIAMFAISTADAGGGLKISGAQFSLGSLIAQGFLTGAGEETFTVVLTATGTCNNEPVSAMGSAPAVEDEETESTPFIVETNNPGDCSNKTEDQNSFVFWKTASIAVYSGDTLLLTQGYNCTTTFDPNGGTVSCTPVKGKGSGSGNGNGTTAICHATGSKKNPYVLLTVNANGLKGHSKHAGDIIPAPEEGCPN